MHGLRTESLLPGTTEESGLVLPAHTAEAGSSSDDALRMLASRAATHEHPESRS
ncbi:hypothetical protein ACQPZZ_17925 [Microbispora sp. CA-135349]|uniref:hypothetical protein n=1 Tax=Microbispora sp. CA-135349 TaxID=3239953 RepID=UPI003D8D749A